MSSLKSAQRTLPSELNDLLVAAITQVCETSFFAFTEVASPELAASAADESRWFHGVVNFRGPMNGRVVVSLGEGLARDLFAAFLGFEDSSQSNPAEIHDVIGEFTNMVCGTWLTAVESDACFALDPPAVLMAGPPLADSGATVMAVNDRPVLVRAEIE